MDQPIANGNVQSSANRTADTNQLDVSRFEASMCGIADDLSRGGLESLLFIFGQSGIIIYCCYYFLFHVLRMFPSSCRIGINLCV